LHHFEFKASCRKFDLYVMNSVFSWKRTIQSVFMVLTPPWSSPPGLFNVNNLAGNLFPERSAHIPPSPSRIVTFLPVQKSFVPAGPKYDVFREGCDKKRHKFKKMFSCARATHSSQKCDKCNASHFLSLKKMTNVMSLTQI